MRKWIVGACTALITAGVIGAVDLSEIPAGTKWLIEVDVQAMVASHLGGMCRERIGADNAKCAKALDRIATFKAQTGINVAKDIANIIVYGRQVGDKSGVAMVRGEWDTAKLTSFIAQQRGFATQTYSDKTILSWVDQQQVFLCLVAPGRAWLSTNESQLRLALDTLAGSKPGLSTDSRLAAFNQIAGTPLIHLLVDGINSAPQVNANAAVLKQTETLQFSLEEQPEDGTVIVELALDLINAEAAGQMLQMLQGMQAMGQMQHAGKPGVTELINAVKITGAGRHVTMRARLDPELMAALQALCIVQGRCAPVAD